MVCIKIKKTPLLSSRIKEGRENQRTRVSINVDNNLIEIVDLYNNVLQRKALKSIEARRIDNFYLTLFLMPTIQHTAK